MQVPPKEAEMEVAFFAFLLTVALMLAVGFLARGAQLRNRQRHQFELFRRIQRGLEHDEKIIASLERTVRTAAIHALVKGQKCKGCNCIVDRTTMKEAGEDWVGRPIYLCKDCRGLIGKD
jgi:hypothetical protein